ncbi:TIGR02285 family protein [Bdellovibrio bacteriovorus]|uniref:TIGR02285 family protein n=1 Tax=Bdellovibrio TaxID=958 RepID=UPI0035A97763
MKWILFTLLLFSLEVAAQPPPTAKVIQWVMTDFPPFLILASQDAEVDIQKAQGPFAEAYRELVRSLPQYEHKFVRASFMRAEKLFSAQKHFCTLLLQETPDRARYLIFGTEVARALPIGLVVPTSSLDKVKKFQSNDGVDLEALTHSEGFRLGVVQGRSYSRKIDPIVDKSQESFKLVSDRAIGGLFSMLEKKRVDGVLAYYLEKLDHDKIKGSSKELTYLSIKQAPPFISVRASCEKSLWGEAMIKEISHVVVEKKIRKKIYDFFLISLPEDMKKKFRDIYQGPPN